MVVMSGRSSESSYSISWKQRMWRIRAEDSAMVKTEEKAKSNRMNRTDDCDA
jgi:hypothetical protein